MGYNWVVIFTSYAFDLLSKVAEVASLMLDCTIAWG